MDIPAFVTKLWEKYFVPEHIRRHMTKVAEVAAFLADRFENVGKSIDKQLLIESSLLHDILKICDLSEEALRQLGGTKEAEEVWTNFRKEYGLNHARTGSLALLKEGFPEHALLVSKHGYNSLISKDPATRPETWEEKILYYADKRVMHDQIVSIEKRLEDGRNRYFPHGNIPKEDGAIAAALKKLEIEICSFAKIDRRDIIAGQ